MGLGVSLIVIFVQEALRILAFPGMGGGGGMGLKGERPFLIGISDPLQGGVSCPAGL